MYTYRYSKSMEPSQGNRVVILETSLTLFATRGYEAVGVAELCETALVTKPTLYHYFGSKRGLLDAIIAEKGNPLLSAVEKAALAQSPRDVPLALEGIAWAFATKAIAEPDFARLRLTLAFAPPASEGGEAIAGLNRALYSHVEVFFQAAAEYHGNMRGRSLPYAAAFIGTIDTYVGLYLAKQSELSEAVVKAAVRQFMYGVFS
jgi:AcrR family transcriptional regulator